MADTPEIAATKPIVETAKAGEYWWCRCGRSQNQPFCDGSHAGTSFEPMKVVIEEDKKVAWCCCKQTGNSPFCDGAHSKLPK